MTTSHIRSEWLGTRFDLGGKSRMAHKLFGVAMAIPKLHAPFLFFFFFSYMLGSMGFSPFSGYPCSLRSGHSQSKGELGLGRPHRRVRP